MKPVCGVYLMISEETGVHYIGAAKDCAERWNEHQTRLRQHNHIYQTTFEASYRNGSLSFVVLEKCKFDNSRLQVVEQKWLDHFPLSVNHIRHVPRIMSNSVRNKVSAAMKGKRNALGLRHTKKTRETIRRAATGRVYIVSEETREKLRMAALGQKHSLATRAKIKAHSRWHSTSKSVLKRHIEYLHNVWGL